MARNETATHVWREAGQIACEDCGYYFQPPKSRGRPPRFCSDRCKQRAYRKRQEVKRLAAAFELSQLRIS